MRSSDHHAEPDPRDAGLLVDDGPAEAEPETGEESGAESGEESGVRLRRVLLIANVAFWVLVCLVQARLSGTATFRSGTDYRPAIVFFLQTAQVSVLMLAAALAAWGPAKPAFRGLCLVIAIGLAVSVRAFFTMRVGTISSSLSQATVESLEWLTILVPAVFCLVVLGSWLRVRIGPPSRGPVRLTIFGMMAATAIISLLVVAKMSPFAMLESGNLHSSSGADSQRAAAIASVAVTGPLLGVAIACMVASAYRWWARLVTLGAIAGYSAIGWHFARQSAPQFPGGQINVLALVYGGLILGMLAGTAWVAFCVRMLDRSGWPCSRR